MRTNDFILSILKTIDSFTDDMVSYAYQNGNENKTNTWYEVACSDYKIYSESVRFSNLRKAWYKAGKARGIKIVFVYCSPKEKNLEQLLNENNLIMVI